MPNEIHRIIDSQGNQMSSGGYPSEHVFLNETKCKKAVDRLNKNPFYANAFSGVPPFYMQSAIPEWKDRNGTG